MVWCVFRGPSLGSPELGGLVCTGVTVWCTVYRACGPLAVYGPLLPNRVRRVVSIVTRSKHGTPHHQVRFTCFRFIIQDGLSFRVISL